MSLTTEEHSEAFTLHLQCTIDLMLNCNFKGHVWSKVFVGAPECLEATINSKPLECLPLAPAFRWLCLCVGVWIGLWAVTTEPPRLSYHPVQTQRDYTRVTEVGKTWLTLLFIYVVVLDYRNELNYEAGLYYKLVEQLRYYTWWHTCSMLTWQEASPTNACASLAVIALEKPWPWQSQRER